ncbi:MAG: hypothetical protein M3O30_14580 [Planctomycetota bacterium]|nr:hypothetical protein [Planctomycetota bacterium]
MNEEAESARSGIRLPLTICCVANLMFAVPAPAAEAPHAISLQSAPDPDQAGQPILPADATWAGVAVIIAGGLFLAAASIGPIVRLNQNSALPADSCD